MHTYPVELIAGAYHNRLFVPFEDYRAFIDDMTRTEVYLHDVARARRMIAPHIARQNRLIAKCPKPPEKTDSGSGGRYIKAVKRHFGADTMELRPMAAGKFQTLSFSDALALIGTEGR